MTDRLYYRDAGLLVFDAVVVDHAGDEHRVVLDRTAFYPTSGGQPHDTGALGSARVLDVVDEDHRIVHVVDAPVPNGPVRGSVDAPRRRDHMQQHTAQHLLSALAADRLGWETVSVHFGPVHSTIEFGVRAVTEGQLVELGREANRVVAEARIVTVAFEDSAVATGLRKAPARSGEIRVITIDGIDRSACGGTHVSRTSEIGPVLLLGTEKIRDHTRIGFAAGDRVLARTRQSDAVLAAVAREMGCAVAEVPTLASARQEELKRARELVSALEREVAVSRLRLLHETTVPGPDGVKRILLRATGESPPLLRHMAQLVAGLSRAVFVAIETAPPTIYFATSADSGVDAGAGLKAAVGRAGGRGGGSARVAQGTAESAAMIEPLATELLGSTAVARIPPT